MQNGRAGPKLAFLGPLGTYSHQVAFDTFGDDLDYYACKTISDVYHSVNATFSLGILPQENSIFGSVIETYDLLRDAELGKSKWIKGAIALPVQHCIVVHKGKTLRDIKRVLSHEQALGQCSQFLQAQLPFAELVRVPSTAGAAEMVSKDPESFDCAAICSKLCVKLFPDLELLHEGIQNEHRNFTRFYVLSNQRNTLLPSRPSNDPRQYALLRLRPRMLNKGRSATITDLLSSLHIPASRVDRRPSPGHDPFASVYIVEISRSAVHDSVSGGSQSKESWEAEVQEGITRVIDTGCDATLLGMW